MLVSTDTIVWISRNSNFSGQQVSTLTYANNLYVAGGGSGNLATSYASQIAGRGGDGSRGGGGGGGGYLIDTTTGTELAGDGGNGGDGYVKITWW